LGTATDSIPRLVAGYQWSTAVALAIQFLESANIVDQAGQHVVRWPFSQRQLEINKQLAAKAAAARSAPQAESVVQAESVAQVESAGAR
jgi:hypothetical protein